MCARGLNLPEPETRPAPVREDGDARAALELAQGQRLARRSADAIQSVRLSNRGLDAVAAGNLAKRDRAASPVGGANPIMLWLITTWAFFSRIRAICEARPASFAPLHR